MNKPGNQLCEKTSICMLHITVGTRRGTAPLGRAVELHRGWLYWLYHIEGGEEAAVGGGFLFQGEGVGSGGGWHAVEAHRAAFEMKF